MTRRKKLSSDEIKAIDTAIEADFAAYRDALNSLPIPNGHHVTQVGNPLRWWSNNVIESVRAGASLFIKKAGAPSEDMNQIHSEIRLFWDQYSGSYDTPEPYRAILWCEHGAQIAFQPRKQLIDNGPMGHRSMFLRAASREELIGMMVCVLTPALERGAVCLHQFLEPALAA